MARGRWKKKAQNAGQTEFVGHNDNPIDPVSRLIALHPTASIAVVAVGSSLRAVDFGTHCELGPELVSQHTQPIRSLSISEDGKLLLTGSDDKRVRIFDTNTWRCIATLKAAKKISAACFTRDGKYAIFSDKFGDVLVGPTTFPPGQEPPAAALMFGHLSSIVTSLMVTPDNKYVISTDRDYKIRCSILPTEPTKGAYDIQSFCLGHRAFVACSALYTTPDNTTLLLTGGGDGTVRLWNYMDSQLLDTFVAAKPVAEAEAKAADQPAASTSAAPHQSNPAPDSQTQSTPAADKADQEMEAADGEEEEEEGGAAADQGQEGDVPGRVSDCDAPAVLSLAVSPSGVVAAAVEGSQEVQLLRLVDACRLELLQSLSLPEVLYPCAVAFDKRGQLWVLGGPPVQGSTSVHLGVLRQREDGVWAEATQQVVGAEERAKLESRCSKEEEAMEGQAEVVSYSGHLKKRAYTVEELLERKRLRNDYKESARLSRMRGAAAEGGTSS